MVELQQAEDFKIWLISDMQDAITDITLLRAISQILTYANNSFLCKTLQLKLKFL